MWRWAIPALVTLVFVGNLLVVGQPSARRVVAYLVGMFGVIAVLALWAESHRDHWLGRLLLTQRGPGSSGRPWTRQERFRAARFFALVGAIALAMTVVVLRLLLTTRPSTAQTLEVYLLPFVMFPAAMGLGGGAYMFLRAVLTSRAPKD